MSYAATALERRFFPKIGITGHRGSCWLWKGSKIGDGYGGFFIDTANPHGRAHRVMYELVYGKVPEGMNVLHRCDNPACGNPDHLFLGTFKDNTQDMLQKGRQGNRTRDVKGERNPSAKLTKSKAEEIRERYAAGEITQRQLATEYGVTRPSISSIIRGDTWE